MKKIVALLFLLGAVPALAQEISGRVMDDKREPLPNAAVQVYQNGIIKGGCITDYNGNYIINPLDTGKYDALAFYMGYDSIKVLDVIVESKWRTTQNFTLQKKTYKNYPTMITREYKKPLISEGHHQILLTRKSSLYLQHTLQI